MAGGLVALLDDVAMIAKLAAASLDDVAGAAGKASLKAAGVVIDDTAVTPRYVTGLTPDRELPIIGKIAWGSLKNKLLFLLPAALLIDAFAPFLLTPLLMIGGTYLCYEGTEKIVELVFAHGHALDEEEGSADPATLEAQKVSGAIRTDFILSAEIMAIALGEVAEEPFATQAAALAAVAVAITVGVYGVVGLIVKMDDIGLHLAKRGSAAVKALGRGLVKAMPVLLTALAGIGVAAMIWVGGGILVHGLAKYGVTWPEHVIHAGAVASGDAVPAVRGVMEWLVTAAGSGVVGLAAGAAVVAAMLVYHRIRPAPAH
ncbi:DUF808 domain-containing protein [Sphingosinicellaceae bacterium]|nr:DUF808 domain-containing protein [Sphingosinicellaceae bacterium]